MSIPSPVRFASSLFNFVKVVFFTPFLKFYLYSKNT